MSILIRLPSPRLQSPVYTVLLLLVSLAVTFLLLQIKVIVGLLFLIAAAVFIPALVLHRREAAYAPILGPDSESQGKGMVRLAGVIGLDMTGIALGVLLLLGVILALHAIGGSRPPHVHRLHGLGSY